MPSNVLSDPDPDPDPDPGNNANYRAGSSPPYVFTIDSPYYRTEVGAFENSASPHGRFDQGGNIWERIEAVMGSFHGSRGGMCTWNFDWMRAANRGFSYAPGEEYCGAGFRVADVSPECGNGIVEFGEECDDGNEDNTDYCISTCQINPGVPTVSEWGVVVMTLLTLTAGTFVFVRRRVVCGPAQGGA